MTTSERLDAIRDNVENLISLNKAEEGKTFLRSIFVPQEIFVSLSCGRGEKEAREILDWFLDGGILETSVTVKTPYGERKNSRKKDTTKFFVFAKGCVKSQIGHISTQNYQEDFWAKAINTLIAKPIGNFCYENKSFIAYALDHGAIIKDLGEKS